MLGIQWYPITRELVDRMLDGVEIGGKILDPSAGDGRLLDYVGEIKGERFAKKWSEYGRSFSGQSEIDGYACEIDSDFRAILREKGYPVLSEDFLDLPSQYYFSLILMNPPFQSGVKHLLHAWHIANGATIKCLLNAESIRNPYTQERKELAEIISQHGSVEYLNNAFSTADRPTNVEIALVTLVSEDIEPFQLDFDPDKVTSFGVPEFADMSLASVDAFEAYAATFEAALDAYKRYLVARKELRHYLKDIVDHPENVIKDAKNEYDSFIELATRESWKTVFDKTKLKGIVTQEMRKRLEAMQDDEYGQMAFAAKNMKLLFLELKADKVKLMTDCVLNAFDLVLFPTCRTLVFVPSSIVRM